MTFSENSTKEIRRLIHEEMRTPSLLPKEFKSWIADAPSLYGMRMPFSQLDGLYVVADRVTGLGPGIHGRLGMVRTGDEPHDYVHLMFDAASSKWVQTSILETSGSRANGAAGSYIDVPENIAPSIYLPNFAAIYNAGLRPQVAIAVNFTSAGGSLTKTYGRAGVYEFDDGDSAAASIGTVAEVTATTWPSIRRLTWQPASLTAPSKTDACVRFQLKQDGSPGAQLTDVYMGFRWISA